ncbi:hypothetical protein cypCar_00019001 [Cyprinus carpio]|nr:hypothetical protein cypCar_00019001 [Cyprinus carpio]
MPSAQSSAMKASRSSPLEALPLNLRPWRGAALLQRKSLRLPLLESLSGWNKI